MPKKAKNAHGEGGVYRLNGTNNSNCTKWMIVIPLGKVKGKYKQRKKRFKGLYTEAIAAKRQMLSERDNGSVLVFDSKLGEVLDLFAQKRAMSGMYAQRTLKTDENRIKLLKFHMEDVSLSELTAEVINGSYGKMRSGDSPSGKCLSGITLLGAHKMLKMALAEPMKKGIISADLFDAVIAPVNDTPKKKALSNKAAVAFIAKLDPRDSHKMALLFCVCVGLRQSEAKAVRWVDIDFDLGVLHLCRSLNPDGTEKPPKTASGTRDLPLIPEVIEALKIRRNEQKRLARIAAGGYRTGDETDERAYKEALNSFVYVCSDGPLPMRPGTFKSWWGDHRKRLGVSCTMHELRHTFLTMLARAKVHPSVMQNFAGHETSEITTEIYTHVDMAEKEEAARALDLMLLKARCVGADSAERAVIALSAAASILEEAAKLAAFPNSAPTFMEELILDGHSYIRMLLEKASNVAAENADMIQAKPIDTTINNPDAGMHIPLREQKQLQRAKQDLSCQILLTQETSTV